MLEAYKCGQKPRVGVIRLRSLGDLIHIIPAVEFLHDSGYEVELWTRKEFGALFINDSRISTIFEAPTGLAGILRASSVMRSRNYDLVLDFQNTPQTNLLSILSGAKIRRKTSIPRFKRYLLLKGLNFFNKAPRFFAMHLRTAGYKGKIFRGPEFSTIENADNSLLDPLLECRKIVAFAPGSLWINKKYPYFPDLCALIGSDDPSLGAVFLGDKNDMDACADAMARWPNPAVNLTGKTSIEDLPLLLSKCCVAVTNDSGIMHISEASGTPVVAFFGPTVAELGFYPWRRKSVVLQIPLRCRPCDRHGGNVCKRDNHECLKLISPERVAHVIKRYT